MCRQRATGQLCIPELKMTLSGQAGKQKRSMALLEFSKRLNSLTVEKDKEEKGVFTSQQVPKLHPGLWGPAHTSKELTNEARSCYPRQAPKKPHASSLQLVSSCIFRIFLQ